MKTTIKENPFSISFGREPKELIERGEELSKIEDIFTREYSSNQVYVITGVRGAGKTVALTKLYDSFKKKDDWITIDIDSNGDMLTEFASKLYETDSVRNLFVKAEINLSAFGIGLNIKDVPPISHISTALEKMLAEVKKQNKRLLVCVDEVSNTKEMKLFASTFQKLMRFNYPVYLLMIGLYQNVDALQNEETSTFLYRAPKINLDSLSIISIANSYKNVFGLETKESIDLAKLTNGYAFAYQLLGFLCFEKKTVNTKEVLPQFDQDLTELAYEKIWSELTVKEKEIVISVAKGNTKPKDIREDTKVAPGTLSTYKMRLTKKGIIEADTYGSVKFALPRFKEIVNETLKYLD